MRKGWEYKKLGEICSSDLGKTLNKSKDVGNMHPYLCAINILWDFIDLTTLKETCFKDDEIDRYTVKYGDLLVCEGGDTGRAAIWDREEPILYQNALHRLRFKEDIDARFIMYNLWHKKQIGEIDNKYSKGVTILHLVKSALLSIPILLPPLSTQLSIVSELDKINELIRLKKEQLKDFDNLAQSLFYEMFGDPVENEKGWEVKKLGEVGELARGVSKHRPRNAPELLGGSMPLIQTGDVANSNFYITKYSSTYSKLGVEQSRVWEAGTLCITIAATIGKCAILGFTACFPDSVVGYKPNNEANTIYMYFIFKNMQKMLEEFAPGVAQKNINLKILSNLDIPLPPLPLQHLFAQRIEQIEHQKAEVQKSITDLETLLASRMQYWFE